MGGGQQEIAVTLLKAASQARKKPKLAKKSTKYLATTKPRSSEKTKADCTHTYHTCIPMKQAEPTATYNLVHALRFSTVMRRRSKIPPSP